MEKIFQTGTPFFSEWKGLWKANLSEADVSPTEYESVSEELDHYCRDSFPLSPKFPEDFYVRGDFTADRTQVIEINNPSILSLRLLGDLQTWLEKYHNNWRILIPTYMDTPQAIILYPNVMRIADSCASLRSQLELVVSRLRRF